MSFVDKTKEELGQYVKKPALTEKLLVKPPFRFIFDIITVVIRQYGLFDGLFLPSELIFENINDKESKKTFLEKVFKCLGIAAGKDISCKPAKLIAGLDPESTNLFLQDLASAITNKIDTRDAVRVVLNGSRRPSIKPEDKAKDELEKGQPKIVLQNGNAKNVQSKLKVKEKEERKTESNNRSTKKQTVPTSGTNTKIKQNDKVNSSAIKKVPQKTESAKKLDVKQQKKVVEHVIAKSGENSIAGLLEEHNGIVEAFEQEVSEVRNGADVKEDLQEQRKRAEDGVEDQQMLERSRPEPRVESQRPQSVKGRLRTPLVPGRTFVVEDKQVVGDSNFATFEDELPRIATARPPTGRVKNVIISAPSPEDQKDEPEEGEEVKRLIELAEQDSYDVVQTEHLDPSAMGHGKLVDTIMATQKELVGDSSVETQADSVKADMQERRKERDLLQDSLQELTRSLRPLLRLMESAQEDSVIMRRELNEWQEKRLELEAELENKRKLFEDSVSPLNEELSELNEEIECQQRKVHAIRSRMFEESQSARETLRKLHTR